MSDGPTSPSSPPVPQVDHLAAEVGISARQLHRHFAAGCPRDSADAIKSWRAENVGVDAAESVEAVDGEPVTLAQAKLELTKRQCQREAALAERYQIENANRRGELVERRQVEQDLSLAFGRLRDRLAGIGTEIANAMPAELKATCKRIADETVRVALKELTDSLESWESE